MIIALFTILLLVQGKGYGIEVGLSAENGGQSLSVSSDYEVDRGVEVKENAVANVNDLSISDSRTLSGGEFIKADQKYSIGYEYIGSAGFTASGGSGSLDSTANLRPESLTASQGISWSGRQAKSGMRLTNLQGSVDADCGVSGGYLTAAQGISSENSGVFINVHGSGESIILRTRSQDHQGSSSIFAEVGVAEGLEKYTGRFDGVLTSCLGHSTDSLLSAQLSGELISRASSTGSESTYRNSLISPSGSDQRGGAVNADLYIHAHSPGTEIIDRAFFYPNPLFRLQPSINAALNGDVIDAAPGIYRENIVIDREITLQGAGNNSDPGSNTIIEGGSDIHPVISITSGGTSRDKRLVIRDLRVNHLPGSDPVAASAEAIKIAGPGDISHITFQDVTVENRGGQANEVTIFAEDQTLGDIIFNRCSIEGTSESNNGILLRAYGERSHISEVKFDQLWINATAFNSFGVLVQPVNGGQIDNVTICNSEIYSSGEYGNGIALLSSGDDIHDILIEGTTINTSGESGDDSYGNGIAIRDYLEGMGPGSVSRIGIHNSNLLARNYGVNSTGAWDIEAMNNWWGSATGPSNPSKNPGGSGSKISDDIEFVPWSTKPN